MTKYVPQHLVARPGRADSARTTATALRRTRGAVAVSTAAALPVGAALIAAPAFAVDEDIPAGKASEKPVLSFNSRGESVVEVQTLMALVRDGYFGPITTSAVKQFQSANNLTVDGVVGAQTWAALAKASNEVDAPQGTPDAILMTGDEGTVVRSLQKSLGVDVDGIFGDKTEAAVIAFQKSNDLLVDGIVGPETATALAQAEPQDASGKQADKKADDKSADMKADKPAETKPAETKPEPKKTKPELADPNGYYELPFPAGSSYMITQGPFGTFSHFKYNDKHAIDFGMPVGAPVTASVSGVVYSTTSNYYGGNTLLIRDASGYCTEYAHLDSFNVVPGQRISTGQQVGRSGGTGANITGPHLHWGIVDCSSYTSIKIPDSKELGRSYIAGTYAVSRNGA